MIDLIPTARPARRTAASLTTFTAFKLVLTILLPLLLSALSIVPMRSGWTQPVVDVAAPDSGRSAQVTLTVLGTVQDAGSPHIGCDRACCVALRERPDPERMVVSLGVVDHHAGRSYLFEATPDMPAQLHRLRRSGQGAPKSLDDDLPDGVFLTHAHIGHYTGLMYFGKEAMGARGVAVHAMPRMAEFLRANGPWSQLVSEGTVTLRELHTGRTERLTPDFAVTPFRVPHRDEYSETVGFTLTGPSRRALFIPDIDKWERWDRDIVEEVRNVDLAFLDATFFSDDELPGRDMSQIPHPFVVESLQRFAELNPEERARIVFIHFNHTNPLLNPDSPEAAEVLQAGFRIARTGDVFNL